MPETPGAEKPKRAIILAAGGGGRLRPLTDDRPKGLLEVAGRAIVEHQIACLRWAGMEEIALVTGHGADKVRERLGDAVTYYHNDRYRETNSLYSAWVARAFGRRGCLILNSDVLFSPRLLERLLSAPHGDGLLIDLRADLGEEEMKMMVDGDGRVRQISKNLDPAQADGENVGIVRLSRMGAERFFEVGDRMTREHEWNHWVPFAVDQICASHPFFAVSTGDIPWIEIDYLHDLKRARESVFPLIHEDLVQLGLY